ncbi:hypothetical protein [uncultured Maribacter sp.]|uniref:hypothetical protein n=1 Tax=uncultured Maribacter sp. TaxID=431308 RepID=UPI002624CAAB|nr:hypothetical protein [uncultured Maribacter sp.]
MNNTIQNSKIADNNSIIAFLVEQYGEKVSELLDKIQSSVVKLDLKGEKDEIAKNIEQIHSHPIESNYKMATISKMFLGELIHNKMIEEIFSKRKEEIELLFIPKSNSNFYLVKLLSNTFENRDSFRNEIQEKFYSKPYSDILNVDIDFLPKEIVKEDVISDDVIEIRNLI